MNPEDAPQINPSPEEAKPPLPGNSEDDPILMGEVSGGPAPAKGKSGTGVFAILGLIVPVVLGGVTVFGVYFLFLEDLLKKPSPPPQREAESPSSADDGEQSPRKETTTSPPQPTFVPPNRPNDDVPLPDESEPAKIQTAETGRTREAEREEDAENALRLARKMFEIKPAAAEEWYRKVVKRYPNTEAARKAREWLTRQAGEP